MSQLFIMTGNLGKDPELRYTPKPMAVCNFSMATTKKIKDKDTTTWINMVAWGKQAEIIEKFAKKGTKLYIEGEFRENKWEKDGVKHSKLVCHIREFEFLSRADGESSAPPPENQQQQKHAPPAEDFDDDIPF